MISDSLVRQTIRDIDKLTKMLRESYVYEDENEDIVNEEKVIDEVVSDNIKSDTEQINTEEAV